MDRSISDDLNKLDNDQSAWKEIGYDEVTTYSAHSRRSRQMTFEYNNPWHGVKWASSETFDRLQIVD